MATLDYKTSQNLTLTSVVFELMTRWHHDDLCGI